MTARLPLGPVIAGIAGTTLSSAEREWLCHPAVGGVILFSRNYESPAQLRVLCGTIRDLRSPALLIQVDQEGGRVQRFREGFTPLPPLAVLGRWYASRPDRACDLAYRHGRVMAAEVLDAGVDQSLAPVLDLASISQVIGDRAMAADPDAVSELAGYYLAGMADAGMAGCGKHFPGHGSVAADTHTEIVRDERSREALERDMRPFARLMSRLPSVMMAHVIYPSVDTRPAGYSERWVGEILRGEMGYRGVVISDDLDMTAAGDNMSLADRLARCLDAGCDLALVCQPGSPERLLADSAGHRWPDAGPAIAALRGKAQFTLEEQSTVPEFQAWRESLGKL